MRLTFKLVNSTQARQMALHNVGGPQPGRTKAKPTEPEEFGQQRPSLDPGLLPPAPEFHVCTLHITRANY